MKSIHESMTATDWMAQLADGELTSAQKAQLTDWLRESPRNVREFVELTLLGQDVSALPLSQDQMDAWVREARETPNAVPISSNTSPVRAGGVRRLYFSLAASLAAVALATSLYFFWQAGRYATGLGEQRILTLPDGSVVTLNTSSELKVDFSGSKRSLRLVSGEAFFRVAPERTRPFEVMAEGAMVKAIGTQFNVRIAPRTTVVSVVDGAVEVREPATQAPPLQLKKGEGARIDRAQARVEPDSTAVARATAWTRGRVEFEATPLADVLSEFRRYREFDVSIEPSLRELKLTGSFDSQDPESAFAYMATLPGVIVEQPSPHRYLVRSR